MGAISDAQLPTLIGRLHGANRPFARAALERRRSHRRTRYDSLQTYSFRLRSDCLLAMNEN